MKFSYMSLLSNGEFSDAVAKYVQELLLRHSKDGNIHDGKHASGNIDADNTTSDDEMDADGSNWTRIDTDPDISYISDARRRLNAQGDGSKINKYWRGQYVTKAGMYWHKFYKMHGDGFFKDRHYLHRVFPALLHQSSADEAGHPRSTVNLLEVGCGCGNAVWPLLDLNPDLFVTAIDFAKSAIEIVKKHPLYTASPSSSSSSSSSSASSSSSSSSLSSSPTGRITAHVVCVVKDPLPVLASSQHLVLCMFVLSAIDPNQIPLAVAKLAAALRPGGRLLVRDYARYDEAQLRFGKGSKIEENFYVRQDGTCSYFFDHQLLVSICAQAGLIKNECYYIHKRDCNRRQQKNRDRIWIHGVFVKGGPPTEEDP